MFLRDFNVLSKAKSDESFMNELLSSDEAMRFIKYVIKSYTKNPARFMQQHRVEWEDLLQAALIGLYNGIKRLDLNKSPNEWVRYIYLTILGEVRKFTRSNNSNMLVISQRIREMYPSYIVFHHEFWVEHGRDPQIHEIMEHFNISMDDAFDLVYGMQQIVSIHQQNSKKESEDIDITLYLSDPLSQLVEEYVINRITIESILDSLSEREREVIYMHYFLDLSKSEIARIIGCANSMINKYIDKAFKKIREAESMNLLSTS